MAADFFGDGPVCVATVICNQVIEDRRTENKTLVGVFNTIVATSVPAIHSRMTVMASVTNAEREITVRLVLRDPEGREMLSVEAEALSPGPGTVFDLLFELVNLTFSEFGDYVFELIHETKVIGARRFTVVELKPT